MRPLFTRKRQGKSVWKLCWRLYIPCPVQVKLDVMRLARENNMTQAELGLMIIEQATRDSEWLVRCIENYRGQGGTSNE